MIRTEGLTKRFGEFIAVNDASFTVERGTIHGFVGPNGAGKSTAIKMLIGALRVTSGAAYVGDHPAGSTQARGLLGYAPEHTNAYDDLDAVSFIVYMAQICGMSEKVAKAKAFELLERLNLSGLDKRAPNTLSAGQKQRLALAQALVHEPEALILDEPTANMDPSGRIAIQDMLADMTRTRGTTIFLSSHILPELEQMVDSLTMINKGRIIVTGKIGDVRKQFSGRHFVVASSNNEAMKTALAGSPAVQEVWIDNEDFLNLIAADPAAIKAEVDRAAAGCGATVEQFSERRATLQDIYKQMVGTAEE
jgi:ABC-2 type transport system ATP-binding protein